MTGMTPASASGSHSREAVLAEWWQSLFRPTRRLSARHRAQLSALVHRGWQTDALCAQADPDAWFPEKGSFATRQVLTTCERCPVRRACLAAALLRGEQGVWAGTTAKDREVLYRALAAGGSVTGVLDLAMAAPPAKLHTLGLPADGQAGEAA
jgi:WhiB family redox-sensing transcriptional regulator